MAGIISATPAQVQTARDKVYALAKVLQDLSQGPLPNG